VKQLWVVVALFGCATLQANAQAGPVVVVPVSVRGQDGLDVSDLKADSFELQDKGKAQTISSFEVMRLGVPGADGKPTQRFTAYLIDDRLVQDTGDFQHMIEAVKRTLATVEPNDNVAIYTTFCSTALTTWTNDAARVRQFLESLIPHAPGPGLCRVSQSEVLHLTLVNVLVSRMSGLEGLRNIVIVSPGYEAHGDQQKQLESVIEAANQARVRISILRVELTPVGGLSLIVTDGLEDLCAGTGGLYGEARDAGSRPLRLPDAVYFLSFMPEGVKADGSVHRLKVAVKDPRRLTVLARKSYATPKGGRS
jgi:VWFA-related protein